jgi:glyoxylase-like metal-dependent hydrolase (beta-lactamase superfamily II)
VASHSIWVAQYAAARGHPVGNLLYGHYNAGTMDIPYSFCVLDGEAGLTLVDTGYAGTGRGAQLGREAGIVQWLDPVAVLARLGFSAGEVTRVIITHAHYDHMGNLGAFPSARVYIQHRELASSLEAFALPDRLGWLRSALNPDDLRLLTDLVLDGRVELVHGAVRDVVDGISLMPAFDTHTHGSQYVVIENDHDGRWVAPGDVLGIRANVSDPSGRYIPLGFAYGSQATVLRTFDEIMGLVGNDIGRLLSPHDPTMWQAPRCAEFGDGLHIAELTIRPGQDSRLGHAD